MFTAVGKQNIKKKLNLRWAGICKMFIKKGDSNNYYMYRTESKKSFRNWFLIKTTSKRSGQLNIGKIQFPSQFIGKRVRLKVEVIKEIK